MNIVMEPAVRQNVGRLMQRFVSSFPDNFSNNAFKAAAEKRVEEDKERLEWRVPYNDRKGEWYSKFKLFAPENDMNSDLITAIQQPINLSPQAIMKWWQRKQVNHEKQMQQFIPDRHRIVGNDLAAAHFIVHRGGAVRFHGSKNWVKRDENEEYTLPAFYDKDFIVEALRCDNMTLYYEGLENLRRLNGLKYLSFKNVRTFDDWCLDRVSGSEFNALETLDLSGTIITEHGLSALYRLPSLKLLIVDKPKASVSFELTCSMLEQINAKLEISDSELSITK